MDTGHRVPDDMLVLARGVGECITIGHDIKVRILSVSGDVVRIGIEAPPSIDVHREEVYREFKRLTRVRLSISRAENRRRVRRADPRRNWQTWKASGR